MNIHISPDEATTSLNIEFLQDVLTGLGKTQKTLPCQWLYDHHGSALFEQITDLPEYYLTRTERTILESVTPKIADRIGSGLSLVEYGAGASVKTRILLDALHDLNSYHPIDVSEEFLLETATQLRADYPELRVEPIISDFLSEIQLPQQDNKGRRAGFFPGSTIGNLSDAEIQTFFGNVQHTLGPESFFILGYDLVKPLDVLIPAYDDAAGVTAAFNLNFLARVNRELGATFDLGGFRHEARWNAEASRIEMHLVSLTDQSVQIQDQMIDFHGGETIHTENSRKFTVPQMSQFAETAGFDVIDTYLDDQSLFAVALLQVAPITIERV